MTASFYIPLSRHIRSARLLLAIAVALPASASLGQAQQAQQPPSLSEKTSTEFQKLKPLQDAKNWDGMIALLDALIPTVGSTSYDMAYVQDMRARLLAGKDQWGKAIEAMEVSLKLSDTYKYFDKNKTLDALLFLAQVSYQEATTVKVTERQRAFLAKASDYFKRWLRDTPKATPEISAFYATILLQQAVADPKNIDQNLLKQAREQVDSLFRTSIRPKEQLYFLLLAILQQENDPIRSAEVLELIVKQFPTKKDYWPQLWATYLNLANDKDEAKSRTNFIRAINTVERAQSQGFMVTPKDNFNLVSLYLQVNQLGKATDLLYDGLKKGTIENDPKNWLYLGYYYVQLNRELQAISTLKEGAALFPKNGQFDLQIGEIHRQNEKMKDASHHYREALRKGGLDRPHSVQALLANVLYELEDLENAMKAIVAAEAFPESAKDTYLPRLKDAIKAAIAERDAAAAKATKK